MPRRSKDRRTSSLDALTAKIDRVAGTKSCIATYLRDVDGNPAMVLMADGCETCREFRAAIPGPRRVRAEDAHAAELPVGAR